MDYVFELEPVTDEALLPQLAAALRARSEFVGRKRYPRLWRGIDWIYSRPRASEETLRRRQVSYRVWGVAMLALAVFVLVPALMPPFNLSLFLAAMLSLLIALQNLKWSRSVHHEPKPDPSVEKAARQLLDGLAAQGRHGGHVTFANAGVELKPSSGESMTVPYDGMDCLMETADLVVLTDGKHIAVLRKAELAGGDVDGWRQFIVKKTETYIDLRA